ncbi:MAG: hypothetical protein QM765_36990 [Myxococcales bacterium]
MSLAPRRYMPTWAGSAAGLLQTYAGPRTVVPSGRVIASSMVPPTATG